jgi:predicted CxxxxCH...CXXCH cytochrome family protein
MSERAHAVLVLFVLLLAGCVEPREERTPQANACTSCHGSSANPGDALTQAAPPRNLDGQSGVSARGVGAHAIHLNGEGRHAVVACKECHVLPETTFAPGHVDTKLPAEVVLGTLAGQGTQPTYDATRGSCADTYCHGSAEVKWLEPRSAEAACGSCHGLPPPAPHPANDQCALCHGDVVTASGFRRPELHVNGRVEVKFKDCGGCHGADKSGAPPTDLLGNTDTSARGVGAHAVHLSGERHRAVRCEECHTVPNDVGDPGHLGEDQRAEVVLAGLAVHGERSPRYDGNALSCGNTYCHGTEAPRWTELRTAEEACGSCHALPPPRPHPAREDCYSCHGQVVNEKREFIAPERHVNGQVDVDASACSSCHGTGRLGAPAPDLSGSSDVKRPGVGAHARHLVASSTHGPVACSECHVVPSNVNSAGHVDGAAPADVTLGPLAMQGSPEARYDRATRTCADSYCHGGARPNWIDARDEARTCGSCHGLPPPAPHPQSERCSDCHAGVIARDRSFTNPALHVNGRVDLGGPRCDSCHGAGERGAPPPALDGGLLTSNPGVGAHAAHVVAGSTHGAVACSECHVVPERVDAPGHVDSALPAEISFGPLAALDAAPAYVRASFTCQNSYCHGSAQPIWTAPRTSDAACGSCHGLPPAKPHPPRSDCSSCHGEVVSALLTFVAPDRHVDGVVDVTLACNSCHGASPNGAPPTDLSGSSDPTSRGVGAHAAHLRGKLARPVACSECHPVPTSVDDAEHVGDWQLADVRFTGVALRRGHVPSYESTTLSCGDTYCHGPADPGNVSPVWNEPATTTCSSCHPIPPPAPHPQFPQCWSCHASVVNASLQIINPALHVNGRVDY